MRHPLLISFLLSAFAVSALGALRLSADPVNGATGYNFYLGTNSGRYTLALTAKNPLYVIDSLPPGQWFCALTATNAAGLESDFSREISFLALTNTLEVTALIATNLNAPKWETLAAMHVPWTNAAGTRFLKIATVLAPGFQMLSAPDQVGRLALRAPLPIDRRFGKLMP